MYNITNNSDVEETSVYRFQIIIIFKFNTMQHYYNALSDFSNNR